MKRHLLPVALCGLVVGCAPPPSAQGPSPEHGFEMVGTGIGQLLLSPLMIAGGLLEGIASLPFLIAHDLHDLNESMVEGHTEVTLDQTYRYAYERPLSTVPASGDTGGVFHNLRDATRHFRSVLQGYGVEGTEHYLLTAVRTADRDGFTLYALVYRPRERITVALPEASGRVVTLGPEQPAYYRPHSLDANGEPLDVVLDWAGVRRTSIRTQKGQAILMTLAASSVLINRRSDDYWPAERRWIDGDYEAVVHEREDYIQRRLSS